MFTDIANNKIYTISTHSLTRRLTGFAPSPGQLIDISTHSLTRRLTEKCTSCSSITDISTHSLTRRLTAILFNKNRFVQFIFIALYQSPPTTSPPSSFFHPIFSFSARISGANLQRIGWGLGVRTIGSGCR